MPAGAIIRRMKSSLREIAVMLVRAFAAAAAVVMSAPTWAEDFYQGKTISIVYLTSKRTCDTRRRQRKFKDSARQTCFCADDND